MGNKVLITIPHPSFHGGVGNIYRVLQLDSSNDVEYFYNTERNRSANLIFFIAMILKFVVRIRGKTIIQINPSLTPKAVVRDGILLWVAKLFNKRVIVFFHGWDDELEHRIKNSRIFRFSFCSIFKKADDFILLGKVFDNKLRSLGVVPRSVYYLPTVADDYYLDPTSVRSTLSRRINLLFMGGFVPSKGIDIVMESFRLLSISNPELFELTMAGDGPQLEMWKNFVDKEKIKNVVFTGYVSGKEKHECLQRADILFFPSLSEGLPCVIMEAMLYGAVIVTRPIGGIPHWVKHEINGWLSDSTDPKVFATGIVSLSLRPDLLEVIRETNKKVALNYFTPDKIKASLARIYENTN